MNRINLVLDLDNTLISSISQKEMAKNKGVKTRNLKYIDMENYYRIFYRPYLNEFLDYAFDNFSVTIWTAGSRDYGGFIIDNIITKSSNKHKRKLKMFFYDENCDQSQEIFKTNTPKDLRYLYNFEGYHSCNTIIVDDLHEVKKHNEKQTLPAIYFDAKKKESETDNFLLTAISKLEEIKNKFEKGACAKHNN
jgi:hypothetical protein